MEQNRKKVGFITLGITLIFGGCVMIITRYGDSEFFKDIFLLWPLFLIILGLEFILTKVYYDSKQKNVQLSPSGISIFLIIIILFTSFLWTGTGFYFPNFRTEFNWQLGQYQYAMNRTLKKDGIPVKGVNKVVVDNARGDVSIIPSEADKITVEVDFRISTNDKEATEELISELLDIKAGKTTRITVKEIDTHRLHSLQSADITVNMPAKVELDITTEFGEVEVSGMKNNVDIKERHSSAELFGIEGNVTVQNEHGAVRAKQITGGLKISNSHGRVDAEDIGGYANIYNEYAPTLVYNVDGDLKIDSKHGELEIKNIAGDIDAQTSYSLIRLENKSYENADIKVETTYGNIIADSDAGLTTTDENNNQQGSALNGNGTQKIRLKNHHGDIRVYAK